MVVIKKKCTKCGRMLPISEFHKHKETKDKLDPRCKECVSKYKKEWNASLKLEAMNVFGSRCVHMKNGIQCPKNAIDNPEEMDLAHPNGDGDEHRDLISNGRYGQYFYNELKKRNWKTGKFDVVVMCRFHHLSLDKSGKLSPLYKKGKFNDKVWIEEKYETMTVQEIADLCGVSYSLILNRMNRFNIKRRKPWQRP